MSPLEKSKFRYDISRNQHHIWRVSECVEWSGVEWCEEKMNLRRNKQTPAHTHARTEHLKAIFWCERTGLCHSATHRCTMLCVLWKLSHFFFLSVLSLWVRVRVSVRVLNIYDDDQLYQNVGKSITKIDGSKNNGPQRKINPNERTNGMIEIIEQPHEMKWNACGAMLARNTCGLKFFELEFLVQKILAGSRIAAHISCNRSEQKKNNKNK